MSLGRRELLGTGAAFAVTAALPRTAMAFDFAPQPGAWRNFEISTRLEIVPHGPAQAWIPVPSFSDAQWFRPAGSTWETDARKVELAKDAKYGAEFVHVAWSDQQADRSIVVTSRFATRDRAIDLARVGDAPALSDADRALFLSATELIPIDGIVKVTSDKITAGATSDLDKARKIYEWIVVNTFRNPKTRGCGLGDIATMLESGNLGGKCADLNALFVGLSRAAGLPARDIYGLRVAPSRFGYKSLGANSETVTKSQHCRAEVYIAGLGWIPVDPADVRKVMLEEPPGNLPLDAPNVMAARKALFGAWETNWLAYNTAHDLALPGAHGPKLAFLMYPQAEVAGVRIDCLDPDGFQYVIKARELV